MTANARMSRRPRADNAGPDATDLPEGWTRLSRMPQWRELAFAGEAKLRDALETDVQARALLTSLNVDSPALRPNPKSQPRSNSRIDSSPESDVHVLLNAAAAVLGLDRDTDFLVSVERIHPSALANVESSIDVRVGLFWAGRALADLLCEDLPLHADPIEGVSQPSRSGRLLRSLWRFQELCRDRYGILVCQSIGSAVQAIRETTVMQSPNFPSANDAFHSPLESDFAFLRAAAINKFSHTSHYRELLQLPQISPNDNDKSEPLNANNFDIGSCVEVCLDGVWQAGIIEGIESPDDLMILLDGEDRPWHFNAAADMIRTADSGRSMCNARGASAA